MKISLCNTYEAIQSDYQKIIQQNHRLKKELSSLKKDLLSKQSKQKKLTILMDSQKKFVKNLTNKIESLTSQIVSLKRQHIIVQPNIFRQQIKQINTQAIIKYQNLFNQYNLITSRQQINAFISFLQNIQIKQTSLLYRASQNNFLTQIFHQKCDGIPHTLTICQTEYGKIIGGYTPHVWKHRQDSQSLSDQSNQSFIFSLSNNHKFKCQSTKYPIFYQKQSGPIFGRGHDLYISDKSNQNKNSYAFIQSTYSHSDYE